MKRIFITGNAGSGKTTLSEKLSKILEIKTIGLDNIVWQPGWSATSSVERAKKIADIVKLEEWIIDGVSKDVLKAADTIVFLDFPRKVSYWRVFKRNWRYLFHSRPGLPEGCPEIMIIKQVLKIIWDFPKKVRPVIIGYVHENKENKNIFHIRTNNELKYFLDLLR